MKELFKDFCRLNDRFRLVVLKKKTKNPTWLKIIYFPFFVLFIGFFAFILRGLIASSRQPYYKDSTKYRKVIKEGLLFDSIEYHER